MYRHVATQSTQKKYYVKQTKYSAFELVPVVCPITFRLTRAPAAYVCVVNGEIVKLKRSTIWPQY